MKRLILIGGLLTLHLCAKAQGAMIVSDPTSIAQRAANFVDQMSEAIEEKYAMYEQVEATLKQAETIKENAKKFQKVMGWVRSAREVIMIIQNAEDIGKELNKFRRQLNDCVYMNDTDKFQLYVKGFKIYSQAMDIVNGDMKIYINDSKSDDENGLSSEARIGLLRNINSDMAQLMSNLKVLIQETNYMVDMRKNRCASHGNLYATFSMKAR